MYEEKRNNKSRTKRSRSKGKSGKDKEYESRKGERKAALTKRKLYCLYLEGKGRKRRRKKVTEVKRVEEREGGRSGRKEEDRDPKKRRVVGPGGEEHANLRMEAIKSSLDKYFVYFIGRAGFGEECGSVGVPCVCDG